MATTETLTAADREYLIGELRMELDDVVGDIEIAKILKTGIDIAALEETARTIQDDINGLITGGAR